MEERFIEFKRLILTKAANAKIANSQYSLMSLSESFDHLIGVIKDNFSLCCVRGVIDAHTIDEYYAEFTRNQVFCNESTDRGYMLVTKKNSVRTSYGVIVEAFDDSEVFATGNVQISAYDNCKVVAKDNTIVYAFGGSKVEAYDNCFVNAMEGSNVSAFDNAYVMSKSKIKCVLYGQAIYRILSENKLMLSENM